MAQKASDIRYKPVDEVKREFIAAARDPRILEEELTEHLEEFIRTIIDEELTDFLENDLDLGEKNA